jgi:hypothetical protein
MRDVRLPHHAQVAGVEAARPGLASARIRPYSVVTGVNIRGLRSPIPLARISFSTVMADTIPGKHVRRPRSAATRTPDPRRRGRRRSARSERPALRSPLTSTRSRANSARPSLSNASGGSPNRAGSIATSRPRSCSQPRSHGPRSRSAARCRSSAMSCVPPVRRRVAPALLRRGGHARHLSRPDPQIALSRCRQPG